MKRICIYLTEKEKLLIKEAAFLSNKTMSAYIRDTLLGDGVAIILNNKERDNLLSALDNPPKPNSDLLKLFS